MVSRVSAAGHSPSRSSTVLRMQPGQQRPVGQEQVGTVDLETAQSWVDGMVEKMTIARSFDGRSIDLLLNEEGKLVGLRPTLALAIGEEVHDVVGGPVVFVAATRDGEWVGLVEQEVEAVQRMFMPWTLIDMKHGQMVPALEPWAWRGSQ